MADLESFIMGGKIFKLTDEAHLILGLRFYGGQIYPISPKLIINSKGKPFLNKKSIGGRCPTLIGCTSATVRKVVWFTGKMKFIFCFILNKR